MGQNGESLEEKNDVGVRKTTRWQQRTRSKLAQASDSCFLPRKALAVVTAFTALFRCLILCSLNFWVENYASAAVGMQMFADKIQGLKQNVERMQISPGQSCPGLEAGVREGVERPRAHLDSLPAGLLLTSCYSRVR